MLLVANFFWSACVVYWLVAKDNKEVKKDHCERTLAFRSLIYYTVGMTGKGEMAERKK